VSELTIIVPLAPGGAKRLRAFLRLLRGNLSQGADKVGTLHTMRFVFFDNDTRLLFATAYDGDWDPLPTTLARSKSSRKTAAASPVGACNTRLTIDPTLS
jgi:hypothetical protein